MLDIKKLEVRWFLLAVFPIGWYVSFELLAADRAYYTILTVVAFLSASLILKMLHGPVEREIHLWIIFILLLFGYFIKFYILCYFKLDISNSYLGLLDVSGVELDHANLIINYYEIITIIFFVFALLIAALTNVVNFSARRSRVYKLISTRITIQEFKVKWLLAFSIACFIVLIYLQLSLGLGFVSGADRQVSQLPYRLAGIIMTIYLGVIPLLLLIAIWLADITRSNYLVKLTVGSYLLFGIVAGLLSTSKAPLISVLISLVVLWLVTGKLTRKRLLLLLSIVPFILIFNGFLSINRMIRSVNLDLGIFEIMWMTFSALLSIDTRLLVDEESVGIIANYLALIMRIDSADSLMNIINHTPSFSLDRTWYLLFISPDSIGTIYAEDVRGIVLQTGMALSPSLLGYFYLVFGNVILVCFGMILYTLVWHMLFRTLFRFKLLFEPIASSLLVVNLAIYTIGGALESMPKFIALFLAFTLFGEFVIRSLTNIIALPNSLSSVKA
jgi:hypothetical protein